MASVDIDDMENTAAKSLQRNHLFPTPYCSLIYQRKFIWRRYPWLDGIVENSGITSVMPTKEFFALWGQLNHLQEDNSAPSVTQKQLKVCCRQGVTLIGFQDRIQNIHAGKVGRRGEIGVKTEARQNEASSRQKSITAFNDPTTTGRSPVTLLQGSIASSEQATAIANLQDTSRLFSEAQRQLTMLSRSYNELLESYMTEQSTNLENRVRIHHLEAQLSELEMQRQTDFEMPSPPLRIDSNHNRLRLPRLLETRMEINDSDEEIFDVTPFDHRSGFLDNRSRSPSNHRSPRLESPPRCTQITPPNDLNPPCSLKNDGPLPPLRENKFLPPPQHDLPPTESSPLLPSRENRSRSPPGCGTPPPRNPDPASQEDPPNTSPKATEVTPLKEYAVVSNTNSSSPARPISEPQIAASAELH